MISDLSEFTHYGDAETLGHYSDQTNIENELTNQLLTKWSIFKKPSVCLAEGYSKHP